MSKAFLYISLIITLFVAGVKAYAAAPAGVGTTLRGTVVDSLTNEPLPHVNVYVNDSQAGTLTDSKGRFDFRTANGADSITVSSLGYLSKSLPVSPRNAGHLKIRLAPADYALQEVIVRPKKQKYSKKDNPAVDFMRRIREHAPSHDPTAEKYYSYDKQEKIVLGLSDFDSIRASEGKKAPKDTFINNYIEKSHASDRNILKISVRERRATELFGSSPDLKKEYTSAVRSEGIDQNINQANVQMFLNDLVRDVDIYAHDITMMQNRFVSPLSPISADYYKFYMDTVSMDDGRYIELTFVPKTPESMSFNGKLYVPVNDSTYTIRRVTMRAPKDLNLNFVRDLYLTQDYVVDSLGNRRKTRDEVAVDMRFLSAGPAFYIEKTSVFDNFSYGRREDLDHIYRAVGDQHQAWDADEADRKVFDQNRLIPLTRSEREMGGLLKNMRRNPWFAVPEKIMGWMINEYICTSKTRSKFDIGPVANFISYNEAEKLRLRFGGITTANLSPHWFGRGFVAYGFGDRKWKYGAEAEYSFNRRKYHSREFPMQALRVSHLYDLDQMGQRYGWQSDNIFTSLQRKKNYRVTYRRLSQLQYVLELRSHLSFDVAFNYEEQQATRWLPFQLSDGSFLKNYRQGWLSAEIRWAPGEKFVQGPTNRMHVNLDAPVFTLRHEYGPKGFLGSRSNLSITTASFKKRFWFSAFGYANVTLTAGKVWTAIDYPNLPWPQANLSYTIQTGTFSLMNPMEFAVDQYAGWDMTYYGNGILFNRLPLIRSLKIREVLGFKGIFGHLSDKNNPELNKSLFPFPEDAKVSLLDPKNPYMECSAGIDNILSLFRVDIVWRLTYRNLPDIDRWGIRAGLHFSF